MKIIAHRGARGLAPENTIAAIKEGLRYHPDMIEIDVRVTKDGVCVLHHDAKLEGGAAIADYTLRDLRNSKPNLAKLTEAIETVNKRVPMYVEIKPRVPTKEIIKTLQDYLNRGWRPEDFFVASFSQKVLQEVHRALPQLTLIVNEHVSGIYATWRARRVGTKYITLNQHTLWGGYIRAVKRSGWKLIAYTVNNPARARRWAKHGLYAIATDYPDRFSQ